MNIKSIKNPISLLVIALFAFSASTVSAYVPGVWDPTPRFQDNQPAFYKVPNPYDEPVKVQTTPVKPISNNNASTNATPKTVATTKTTAPRAQTVQTPAPADVRDLPPVVTTGNSNDLAALSLQGSGGFMPSSVWQWLFVILLILAIIIIARMLGRAPAHHETHTVATH